MGLKNLTADLSNFYNINQRKVDSPVGDFKRKFRERDNSKIESKLTVPPSADFDRRNMYIRNSPEGSFGKFKIFNRNRSLGRVGIWYLGNPPKYGVSPNFDPTGDLKFKFKGTVPYEMPYHSGREFEYQWGRKFKIDQQLGPTHSPGSQHPTGKLVGRGSSPLFGNTGFYDKTGKKYGDKVPFGRNFTSEKSFIVTELYKGDGNFEENKTYGFKSDIYGFHSHNINAYVSTGTAEGTANYNTRASVGPFDINNQLGGSSSPIFGNTGFGGDNTYKKLIGYSNIGAKGISIQEDTPGPLSIESSKKELPLGVRMHDGISFVSPTTDFTFDEGTFEGNRYEDIMGDGFKSGLSSGISPGDIAVNTPVLLAKSPGLISQIYGSFNKNDHRAAGDEYRIKGSGGNADYMDKQPYIVRKIGNRWGSEPLGDSDDTGILQEGFAFLDDLAGQFVRGAPGFTGYLDRAFNDVLRIGKFTFSGQGASSILKQFVLNFLNPRAETRIYNPLSIGSIIPMFHINRHFGKFSIRLPIIGEISKEFGTYSDIASSKEATMAKKAIELIEAEQGVGSVESLAYLDKLGKYQEKFYGKVQGTGDRGKEASKLEINLLTMRPRHSNHGWNELGDHEISKDGIRVKLQGDKYRTDLTDKVNLVPYHGWGGDGGGENKLHKDAKKDFVPFRFRDIVNGKWIIFRAILSGISDTITPEWNSEKYIGRPDKVHVYTGAERIVSFNFDVYPKTVQELPVLWEKLNYLVGLCYPSFNQNRMIAPFINLTIGNIFNNTPGFLNSLTLTVPDGSTWEMASGLKLPKHIQCSCGFTYVGKYLPSTLGKHYELPWLEDKGWSDSNSGTFHTSFKKVGKEIGPNVKKVGGNKPALWEEIDKAQMGGAPGAGYRADRGTF